MKNISIAGKFGSLLLPALMIVSAFAGRSAHAADPWPSRPIRIVIPYAAGNTGDITLRFIQARLQNILGAAIVIDNKSGASGNIGAEDVVRSLPDGYTFLLGATNNYVTNQFLYKQMRFDPLKDLVPVSLVSNAPSALIVNANAHIETLADLTAAAKKSPGKLNFGSPGNGTPPHLAAELYSELAGVKMTHIPYRGSPPAVQALMGDEIQLYVTAMSSVVGPVASGKLKAIAVASPQRLALLPDVPTTAEAGLPGLVTGNWWGLSAPGGVDPAIVQKMSAAVASALDDAGIKKQFSDIGVTPIGSTPADFAKSLQREAVTWKDVIDRANIVAE